jgi:hypothetical protein
VVLDDEQNIIGWCGVSYISNNLDVCEISDFFLSESFRDSTTKLDLLRMCNMFAEKYYKEISIEISSNTNYLENVLKELGYTIDTKSSDKTRYVYKFKKRHWVSEIISEFVGELLAGVILIGFGALALLILPKKLTENVDFEILMLIGAIIILGVPILIGLLIEFIRKKKGRKK